MNKREKKRYQECNKFVKIIRSRWNLLVPFEFLYLLIKSVDIFIDVEDNNGGVVHTNHSTKADKDLLWSIACGNRDQRKKHYYTIDEVMDNIKTKPRKIKWWQFRRKKRRRKLDKMFI